MATIPFLIASSASLALRNQLWNSGTSFIPSRPLLARAATPLALAPDKELVPDRWRGPSSPPSPVAWGQLSKYPVATFTEWALISSLFLAIDSVVTLPAFTVPPLFFFMSLRSRIFSPLLASRPNRAAQGGKATPSNRKVPDWMPPGIAFSYIWLTISGLRASSSFLVWRACGRKLCCWPLLVLMLHLCVGDTWNSITK